MRYRDDASAWSADTELSGALSLTMQSLQTLNRLAAPAPTRDGGLVEVARGRPYQLSSAYGASSRTGVVEPHGNYFFHTDFGKDQSIRVDLGRRRPVRRIEVTNRRGGYQERAKHIFAVLSDGGPGNGVRNVFPMYAAGELPGEAWQRVRDRPPGRHGAVRHDHVPDEHRAALLGPEDLRRRRQSTGWADLEAGGPARASKREDPNSAAAPEPIGVRGGLHEAPAVTEVERQARTPPATAILRQCPSSSATRRPPHNPLHRVARDPARR